VVVKAQTITGEHTMKKKVTIHISDCDENDWVISIPLAVAKILTDMTKKASDRMGEVHRVAAANNDIEFYPCSSTIDNADIFLSWPGTGFGFVTDAEWDAHFAEELMYIRNLVIANKTKSSDG
jgi:hypothetical protein